MRTSVLLLSLFIAAAPASEAIAQDAPKPGDAAKPADAPKKAEKRKPVKDPTSSVAKGIREALEALFDGSGAGRIQARSTLDTALSTWSEAAKDNPLRATAWWKTALQDSLPSDNAKSGVREVRVPYLEGRASRLMVSVPSGYSTKNLYPLVVTLLPRNGDGKRVIKNTYGPLLKTWIVVGIPTDKKLAGFDVVREPWMAGVGLRHAMDSYRIDRDRVVLDGLGEGADTALALGSEWAVHFAGVVLRSPGKSTDLASNLALGQVCMVLPETPAERVSAVAATVTTAAGEERVKTLTAGKETPTEVAAWLQALPPRAIGSADSTSYSWTARPQGGEVWSYWMWVFRATRTKAKDRANVTVTWTCDRAANSIDISSSHLAEGILLLNDDILDLDKEVTVKVNDRQVFKGTVERNIETALYWIGQTGERMLWVPAEVRFTVPDDVQIPGAAKDKADKAAKKDDAAGESPEVPEDAPKPPKADENE